MLRTRCLLSVRRAFPATSVAARAFSVSGNANTLVVAEHAEGVLAPHTLNALSAASHCNCTPAPPPRSPRHWGHATATLANAQGTAPLLSRDRRG